MNRLLGGHDRTDKTPNYDLERWNEKAYPRPSKPLPLDSIAYSQLAGRFEQERKEIGRLIFQDGSVTLDAHFRCEAYLLVDDSELDGIFHVHIWGDKQAFYSSCDCPFTAEDPKLLCEHKHAAKNFITELTRPSWTQQTASWADRLAGLLEISPAKSTSARQLLVFKIDRDYRGWGIVPYGLAISHLSGVDLTDTDAVRKAIVERKAIGERKSITGKFDPARYVNASEATVWLAQAALMSERSYRDNRFSLDSAIRALENELLFHDVGEAVDRPVIIDPEPGEPLIDIGRNRRAIVLKTSILHRGQPIEIKENNIVWDRPLWVLSGDRLICVPTAGGSFASAAARPDIRIPVTAQEAFLSEHLPALVELYQVESELVDWTDIDVDPIPRVYLSESGGELVLEARFAYGEIELPAEKAPLATAIRKVDNPPEGAIPLTRIHRRIVDEAEYYQKLPSMGLKRGQTYEQFYLKSRLSPVDFLLHSVPKLTAAGFEIFGEDNLASVRVNRNLPRLEFMVSSGIDWLDLKAVVTFGNLPVSLVDFSKAIRKREKYVKLADGSIGAIPPEWIEKYKHLFSFGEIVDDGLRVSNRHVALVEDAMEMADHAQADAEFDAKRNRLRAFSHIAEHALPTGLKAELRPYQKAGFDWLHFLHDYEFGGCLADDMGVGKTVQALAFLLSLKETGESGAAVVHPGAMPTALGRHVLNDAGKPSRANLIVLPRSLIFNWEREVQKFTPTLRVLVHAENKRSKDIAHLDDYDLVLTTYGVMLRDIDVLRKYRFHYVVLDEAQTIKNPLSLTGRSARLLQSDHRLVLTGTPVENSTIDLWSQFEFLNPGLLGSLEYFRSEFSAAIEKKQDDASASLLRRMVFPFILRRTKDQVATDLPPRTEKILLAEMEPEQQKLYNKTRDHYRDELLGIINKEGMNNARMKMLEALLRLRQIANHPKLMDDASPVESGKFELLIETLETLRAEGHKALVFSQFVRMLTIVRNRLDADGVPYAYLDGQTKNRQVAVDNFQADTNLPFFLISLKAGGVGLNLTAADYVVHIDPWWNPAVERQATDRTHRIGQDKPVFVYKLITRGTVEEKILDLQERKRRLVDQLVAGEQSFLKSLTTDDVAVLFS